MSIRALRGEHSALCDDGPKGGLRPEECVKNEDFTDTRPPPTGTPSNLEGELWLLLNLIYIRVESEQK